MSMDNDTNIVPQLGDFGTKLSQMLIPHHSLVNRQHCAQRKVPVI